MKFTKENAIKVFDEWIGSVGEDMSTLNKRIEKLDDMPEKVVVPKFVAKWYGSKLGYNILGMIEGLRTGECIEKAVHVWLEEEYSKYGLRDAFDLLALIRINGYEIEKEPLYKVLIPFEQFNKYSGELGTSYQKLLFDNTSDETRFMHKDYMPPSDWAEQLTESEIKSIDERFWPFAVKVEESE